MNRNDLKIFKPERLGSDDNAGGLRTRNEIVSGSVNELFDPISNIDHAQSAIDIVKCYPSVDTPGTEKLLDAHVFLSQPPTDPLVNIVLVESDDLTDAARLSDMKEILESSVTAGSLVREGMPGFLPNQNSFSRDYLQSIRVFNGNEYRVITSLRVGQVVAISVEYEGNEDINWPRFIHYAQVTDINAPGNSAGNIVFDPPMPAATPEWDRGINNEANCTKLRLVNEASPLSFHGVTKLVEDTVSRVVKVSSTKQSILPTLTSLRAHAGLTLNSGDAEIVKKTVSQIASSAQSYLFSVSDVLQGSNGAVDYQPEVIFTSNGQLYSRDDAIVTLTPTELSVTLSRAPDIGSNVSVSYISTTRYSDYDNVDDLPADKSIIRGSLIGKVTSSHWGAARIIIEKEDGIYYRTTGSYSQDVRAAILSYSDGVITYEDGHSDLEFICLIGGVESDSAVQFNLNLTRPVLSSFYLQVETVAGALLSASSDDAGVVTGSGVTGTISNGFVSLAFTQTVKLSTLIYDISENVDILPPAEIYNLNPLRLPTRGLVDIFRPWGVVSIQHTQNQSINSPANGNTVNVRIDANFVDITDADGASLWTPTNDHYSVNKSTGVVTLNSDFSDFSAPFIISDTLSEEALVLSVSNTEIELAEELSRSYPVGSTISSIQKLGDQQARIENVRDMTAWSGNWELDGDPADSSLNVVDFPIIVANDAAINEEWLIQYTSETSFNFIGRRVGQVATGDTLTDFSPLNPLTGKPFFTIPHQAFGSGWSQGECVRFRSVAASNPVMPVRVTQSGHSVIDNDQVTLVYRGNEA